MAVTRHMHCNYWQLLYRLQLGEVLTRTTSIRSTPCGKGRCIAIAQSEERLDLRQQCTVCSVLQYCSECTVTTVTYSGGEEDLDDVDVL